MVDYSFDATNPLTTYCKSNEERNSFLEWLKVVGNNGRPLEDDWIEYLNDGRLLSNVLHYFGRAPTSKQESIIFSEFHKFLHTEYALTVRWGRGVYLTRNRQQLGYIVENLIQLYRLTGTTLDDEDGDFDTSTSTFGFLQKAKRFFTSANYTEEMLKYLDGNRGLNTLKCDIIQRGFTKLDKDVTGKDGLTILNKFWQVTLSLTVSTKALLFYCKLLDLILLADERSGVEYLELRNMQGVISNTIVKIVSNEEAPNDLERLLVNEQYADLYYTCLRAIEEKRYPSLLMKLLGVFSHIIKFKSDKQKQKEIWRGFCSSSAKYDYSELTPLVLIYAYFFNRFVGSETTLCFTMLKKLNNPATLFNFLLERREFTGTKEQCDIVLRRIIPYQIDEKNICTAWSTMCELLSRLTEKLSSNPSELVREALGNILLSLFDNLDVIEQLISVARGHKYEQILNDAFEEVVRSRLKLLPVNKFIVATTILKKYDLDMLLAYFKTDNVHATNISLVVDSQFRDVYFTSLGTVRSIFEGIVSKCIAINYSVFELAVRATDFAKVVEDHPQYHTEIKSQVVEILKRYPRYLNSMYDRKSYNRDFSELNSVLETFLFSFARAFLEMKSQEVKSNMEKISTVSRQISEIKLPLPSLVFHTVGVEICSEAVERSRIYTPVEASLRTYIKLWNDCPQIHPLEQAYTNMFEQYILAVFDRLASDLELGDFTEADFNTLSRFPDSTEKLFCSMRISNPKVRVFLVDTAGQFAQLKEKYGIYLSVYVWLRKHNLVDDAQLGGLVLTPYSQSEITLSGLKEVVERAERLFSSIPAQSMKTIEHFDSENSSLFQIIFNTYYGKGKSIDSVARSVIQTENFIRSLLDDEQITLRSLEEVNIDQVIREIRKSGRTLESELKIVERRFNSKSGKKSRAAFNIERFAAALKLKELGTELVSLVLALEEYNMDCCKHELYQQIKQTQETITSQTNIPLSEVQTRLRDAEQLLCGLQSFHMKYFELVRQADTKKLVEYLKSQADFEQKVQILRGKSRKDKFQESVIADLLVSKTYLEPFLSKDTSFKRIAEKIQEYIRLEDDLKKLNSIESCSTNLSHIRLWFSNSGGISLNDVQNTIMVFKKHGRFFSRLKEHTEGALFTIKYTLDNVEMDLTEDDLGDFVRLAVLRSTDRSHSSGDSAVSKKVLKDFIDAHRHAQEAHKYRLLLEASGHAKYQGREEYLDNTIDPKKLKDRAKFYKVELNDWLAKIKKYCAEFRYLLRFSRPQLIHFVKVVKSCLEEKESETADSVFSKMKAYVGTCFFEANQYITRDILFDAFNNNNVQKVNDDLGKVVQLLTNVAEAIGVDIDPVEPVDKATRVIKAKELTVETLCLVFDCLQIDVQSNKQLVHHGRVFLCSENTTTEELKWFNMRRSSFTDESYVILGVDLLQPHVREQLIKFEEKKISSGETYLIFFKNSGIDAFNFLNMENASSENAENYRRSLLANKTRLWNLNSIQCIDGPPASGKSRWIAKQAGENTYLRIHVNEEFTTAFFLQHLNKCEMNSPICIHFDISEFADMVSFEQFLFTLLYCGVFTDQHSGVIQELPATDLDIYFELPSAAGDFLSEMPSIKLICSNVISITRVAPDFEADTVEARKVATMLNFYNIDKRGFNKNDLTQVELLDAELSKNTLAQFFSQNRDISNTMMHKALFVRLMYDRCLYLEARRLWFTLDGLQEYVPNFNTRMFDIFLKECISMCNEGIRRDWSRLPVAFTSRCSTSSPPDHDVLHMSGQEDVRRLSDLGVITRKDVTANPAKLRRALAHSLGLAQTDRLVQILKQHNYTLTVDFGLKLLMLNERRKAKISAILSGQTGTGKSEALRVYAEILNHNSEIMPDMRFLVQNWFIGYLHQNNKYEEYEQMIRDILQLNQNVDISTKTKKFTITYIQQFLNKQRQNMEENYYQNFTTLLATSVKEILDRYPLLGVSQYATDIIAHAQKGEMYVDSVTQIIKFIEDVVAAKPRGIFHKLLMHPGWNTGRLRKRIQEIVKETNECTAKYADFSTVVFVDELNTGACIGTLKEIFSDHMLDGVKLPENIFFVGAINPLIVTDNKSEYLVRKLPDSMHHLILDFDELSKEQEEEFIRMYLLQQTKKRPDFDADQMDDFLNLILFAQRFVAKEKMHRVRVSIRDMLRAVQVYFFLKDSNPLKVKESLKHIICMFMAIAMSYYLRLPYRLRTLFNTKVNEMDLRVSRLKFDKVVDEEMRGFYKRIEDLGCIPQGIAQTRALVENLFCNIICIQSGIPLIITGPPGTSKTLSFNIATSTKKELFESMKTVHRAHYQCNEMSTAQEIRMIFKTQISMKHRFQEAGMISEICSVFLDEAGLPVEASHSHAMKVIHYYLDHPEVSTVIIANTQLDAAKTNRGMQLLQPETDFNDLNALCEGCLGFQKSASASTKETINGLCRAFEKVNTVFDRQSRASKEGLFHLRDFVYFLRMCKRNEEKYGGSLKPSNILHSLQRNFNGVSAAEFEKIVNLFFSHIHEKVPVSRSSYIKIVGESLNDRLKDGEDPNSAPLRYVLIVDPTESGTAINLLFSENLLSRESTQVVSVSDFSEDNTTIAQSAVLSKVKLAMETGQTLVLVNSQSINTNLYDVFNRHFSALKSNGEFDIQYFANVAVGGLSKPCAVHKNFQVIVHISMKQYMQSPLPFLNRFEKYIVGYSQLLSEKLDNMSISSVDVVQKQLILNALRKKVEEFVEKMGRDVFFGYLERETIESILYLILHSTDEYSNTPNIPLPFRIALDASKSRVEDEPCTRECALNPMERLTEFIRRMNFLLLQAAKPQCIYLRRNIIPKAYLEEYLAHQEHFSAKHVLHSVFDQYYSTNSEINSNWMLFTRSNSNIYQLLNRKETQDHLLDSLRKTKKLPEEQLCPTNSILDVFSLSQISSQTECDQRIDDFVSSETQSILLITVDMNTVSKSQISYVKHLIDEKVSKTFDHKDNSLRQYKQVPFVCLLCHFTPAAVDSRSHYDNIFQANWSQYYTDSFDFSDEVKEYCDPRYWLAVAIGYTKSFASDGSEMIQDFNSLYMNAVEVATKKYQPSAKLKTKLHFQGIPFNAQTKHVAKVITDSKWIQRSVMKQFSESWSEEKLAKIVKRVSTTVEKAESANSMLSLIYRSLEYNLVEIVEKYVSRLVELVCQIPELNQLPEQYALGILNSMMKIDSGFKLSNITETIPLSSILLSRLLSTKVCTENSKRANEELLDSLDDELKGTLALIESNNDIFIRVTNDFMVNLYGLKSVEEAQKFRDLVKLPFLSYSLEASKVTTFVITYLFESESMKQIIYLMRRLPLDLSGMSSTYEQMSECESKKDLLNLLMNMSVDHAKKQLVSILEGDQIEEHWLPLFERVLIVQPNLLSKKNRKAYNFCMIVYLFLLECTNKNENCLLQMRDLLDVERTHMNKDIREYIVTIVATIFNSVEENISERRIRNWLSLVLTRIYNFSDDNIKSFTQQQLSELLRIINNRTNDDIWELVNMTAKARVLKDVVDCKQSFLFDIETVFDAELQHSSAQEAKIEELMSNEEHETLNLQHLLLRYFINSFSTRPTLRTALKDYKTLKANARTSFSNLALYAFKIAIVQIISRTFSAGEPLDIETLLDKDKREIATIMADKSLQLYLISLLPSEKKIEEFLRNTALLTQLSMREWHLPSLDLSACKPQHFPFMYEQSAVGNEYKRLLALFISNDMATLSNSLVAEPNIYQSRFLLMVICFHEYFMQLKACVPVEQLLNNQQVVAHLQITEEEKILYRFFAAGPLTQPQDKSSDMYAHYLFSREYLQNTSNSTTIQLLLGNIAAVCLGVPKEKSHLYYRALHPEVLPNNMSPGSTMNNVSKDCGYQAEGLTLKYFGYDVLNKSALHHSALNTLTWGAFALCLLTNPQRNFREASKMLTYVNEDSGFIRNMTPQEKSLAYIFARVGGFVRIFENNDAIQSQNIDILTFFTHSLYNFYLQAPNSQDAKGLFAAPQPVRQYENFVRDACFQPVLNNYTQIKRAQQQIAQQNEIVSRIFASQEKVVKVKTKYNYYMHKTLILEEVAKQGGDQLALINRCKDLHQKLSLVSYLPILVDFYVYIHKNLNRKYKANQIFDVTLRQAIIDIEPEKQEKNLEVLTRFIETWQALQELDACNQVERATPVLEEDSMISFVLKTDNNYILHGINTIFNAIAEIQRVAEMDMDNELDCEEMSILYQAFGPRVLVVPQDDVLLTLASTLCHISSTNTETTRTFSWKSVEYHFRSALVLNKPILNVLSLTEYPFSYKEEEVEVQSANIDEESTQEETSRQQIIPVNVQKLNNLVNSMKSNGSFVALTEDPAKLARLFNRDKESQLLDAITCSLLLLLQIKAEGLENIDKSTLLAEYANKNGIEIKHKLLHARRDKILVVNALHVAELTLKEYMSFDPFIDGHGYNSPLFAQDELFMQNLKQKCLECFKSGFYGVEDENRVQSIRNIADCLRNKQRLALYGPNDSVREKFNRELSQIPSEELDQALPQTIIISQLFQYLRHAQSIYITFELMRCNAVKQKGDYYKETVPEDWSKNQINLQGCEPSMDSDSDEEATYTTGNATNEQQNLEEEEEYGFAIRPQEYSQQHMHQQQLPSYFPQERPYNHHYVQQEQWHINHYQQDDIITHQLLQEIHSLRQQIQQEKQIINDMVKQGGLSIRTAFQLFNAM